MPESRMGEAASKTQLLCLLHRYWVSKSCPESSR